MTDHPFRVQPVLDDENRFFWTSGEDGRLRFLRCQSCGYYLHPPLPRCPECGGRELEPEAVSGRGEVHSFTVNHQPWDGGTEPYAIALVAIPEQEGLRLTTNIVGCPPRRRLHRHAGAGRLRAARPRLLPVSSSRSRTDRLRAAVDHLGDRAVRRRAGGWVARGSTSRIDAALEAIADAGLTTGRHRRHRHLPGGGGRRRASAARARPRCRTRCAWR